MSALPKPQEEFRAPRSKPVPVFMRNTENGLVPADRWAEKQWNEKKLKLGDIVKVFVRKLRNGKFNRKVHRIGKLCVDHIDEFRHMDAHSVIKRMQLEGNIYCDEMAIKPSVAGVSIPMQIIAILEPILNAFGLKLTTEGLLIVRYPQSLSYESMSQDEYEDAARRICLYLSENYWHGLKDWQIDEMAENMAKTIRRLAELFYITIAREQSLNQLPDSENELENLVPKKRIQKQKAKS